MKFSKFFLISLFVTSCATADEDHQAVLKQLSVPDGFSLTIFAKNLPNVRTLALGDKGIVYAGTRQQGSVYAIQDVDNDGIADKNYTLATGLYMPNGVAYKNGALYVAQPHRIIRFDNIAKHLAQAPEPAIVYEGLPSDKHHGWKYLRFGEDNKLYSAVGAPCNVCEPSKEIYGTLFRLNADGSDFEILASGVRNTVGFDWHPESKALYFTENGRDHLGDDVPPDELNKWTAKGQHFGYPYCHAGEILDPEFGKDKNCADFVAPAWKFKAHNAPLGMRFYQGDQFPSEYKNQLFVAQHGSWNRSTPDGYRIALVKFKEGKAISEEVFISGWLTKDEKVLGRPTDILEMPDGSLLIADDKRGVIYKVSYKK
ncbi:MAG: sorbosone dehydrogenase family protein [Methylococcaceae bacterium]|nr:sorbosone dehydrogenase family protein [Methylococcaceae bacterium]